LLLQYLMHASTVILSENQDAPWNVRVLKLSFAQPTYAQPSELTSSVKEGAGRPMGGLEHGGGAAYLGPLVIGLQPGNLVRLPVICSLMEGGILHAWFSLLVYMLANTGQSVKAPLSAVQVLIAVCRALTSHPLTKSP